MSEYATPADHIRAHIREMRLIYEHTYGRQVSYVSIHLEEFGISHSTL